MTPALAVVDDYIQSEKSGVTSDGEQLIPVGSGRYLCHGTVRPVDTFVSGAIIHQIANTASSHGSYIGCQNSIPISMSLRTKLLKILTPLLPRSCSSTVQVKAANSLYSYHNITTSMLCLLDSIPSWSQPLSRTRTISPATQHHSRTDEPFILLVHSSVP